MTLAFLGPMQIDRNRAEKDEILKAMAKEMKRMRSELSSESEFKRRWQEGERSSKSRTQTVNESKADPIRQCGDDRGYRTTKQ